MTGSHEPVTANRDVRRSDYSNEDEAVQQQDITKY